MQIKEYPVSYLFEQCAFAFGNPEEATPETKDFYDVIGKDVNYKFVEEGDVLFIYFQGSRDHSGWDWFRNFFHFPWRNPGYSGCRSYLCHSGYLMAWMEVKDVIINKITETDEEGYYKFNQIIIVGYSFGGAMAVLCKECCWYYRHDIDKYTTGYAFESPRVLFGLWMPKKLRRRWKNFFIYRNKHDIVTHVPFRFLGFIHPVKPLYIGYNTHGPFKDHKSENVLAALKMHEQDPYNF